MAYVKGSSRVLRQPEVFTIHDDHGHQGFIEIPAGTRVRLQATTLPDLGPPLPAALTAAP